jgi:hypothetical protein
MTLANMQKIQDYALSGEDLQKLVGKIRFIKYPDIDQETIQSLFRLRKEVVVLFLTTDSTTGHWICVLEHPNKVIEVFDSYGLAPDGHREMISKEKLTELDQHAPQFKDLLSEDPSYTLIHNTKPFQKKGTATCGRHVAVRILHKNMDLDSYVKFIEEKCRETNQTPDELVTVLTYEKLKK